MERKGGTILSHFLLTTRYEYDIAVYSYLWIIVLKSLPIYHVTAPEVRKCRKFEANIGRVTVVKVIFASAERFEQWIATEVQYSQSALLFDGWSRNDMQFIPVMITHCFNVHIREGDKINSKSEPELT